MVTELGEQSRSQEFAGTRQGLEDEGIGVLGEELSQARESFRPTEYLRQEQFGQDADLVTIGCYCDRVGFWGGIHQVSVTSRDEVHPAITMFSTESLKSSSSQALGFLGRGIGHEEMEVDLGGEFSEEAQSLGIDPKQYGPELVGLALDRAAQEVDEPHLSQDLLGQSRVGLQTAMAVQVGVEDAGQESRIGVIGVGVGAAQAIAVAFCGLGAQMSPLAIMWAKERDRFFTRGGPS